MPRLTSLSSDILFEVLEFFDDLQDLNAAVRSCRALQEAFQARRLLLLQEVFYKQVTIHTASQLAERAPIYPSAHSSVRIRNDVKVSRVCILNAENIIQRCTRQLDDALCLRTTAWKAFLTFESRGLWMSQAFGKSLIVLSKRLGRDRDAIVRAEQLLARAFKGRTIEVQSAPGSSVQADEVKCLVKELATLYCKTGQVDEALQLFQKCYESWQKLQGNDMLAAILALYRVCPAPVGHDAFVQSLRATIEGERLVMTNPQPRFRKHNDQHSVRALVLVLFEVGQVDAAIKVLLEALTSSEQHGVNFLPLVGLSRILITKLKKNDQRLQALTVRKHIHDIVLGRAGNWSDLSISMLVAWAKDYSADLSALGRHDAAVSVVEQVWQQLVVQFRGSQSQALAYHCRTLASSLSRAYREKGDLHHAEAVLEVCERIGACQVPDMVHSGGWLSWIPGTRAYREKPSSDINVPIIV